MKTTIVFLLFFPFFCRAQLNVIQKSDGWLVSEGKKNVLFYVTKDRSLDGKYTRSHYVHPLYSLSGEVLTEDFPSDHPHQRGIFWAWHQVFAGNVRLGDAWLAENFRWDVVNVQYKHNTGNVVLMSEVLWKSPDMMDDHNNEIPVVKESCSVTVHAQTPQYRIVDFNISLQALLDSVFIGGSEDVKGYGGFSARIKLPEEVGFTALKGEVTPQTESIKAGGWMDIRLKDEPAEGLILMDHPDNKGYPNQWILRKKNSMQNIKYPGRTPVQLDRNDPLTLKYRIIVYKSRLGKEALDRLHHY